MHIFKKLAMYSLSMLMMVSVGSINASAKSVHHHYHVRTSRYLNFKQLMHYLNSNQQYKPIVSRTLQHDYYRFTNHQLAELKSNPNIRIVDVPKAKIKNHRHIYRYHVKNIRLAKKYRKFDSQVRQALINDINRTRRHYGRRTLTESRLAQRTADYRVPYVQYAYEHYNDYKRYPGTSGDWVHGNDTRTDMGTYLYNHSSYDGYASENADEFSLRRKSAIAGYNKIFKYSFKSPKDLARGINNSFMYYDNSEGNHNGHRDNELDSKWKHIGIGVVYNPKTDLGTVNEQYQM